MAARSAAHLTTLFWTLTALGGPWATYCFQNAFPSFFGPLGALTCQCRPEMLRIIRIQEEVFRTIVGRVVILVVDNFLWG